MPRPNKGMRVRGVRFTDAEWAEIGEGAQALGETRADLIRRTALGWARSPIGRLAAEAAKETPRGCVYCHRFTDMQDSLPVKGGGSAHAACAMRASLAVST